MDDCRRISCRVVLASAAFSFGAAAAATVVSRTAAQQKLSQGDAKYQTAPKGDQRCEGCANFQAPNGCKFVQGTSARTAGASCLSGSPNRQVHFPRSANRARVPQRA
jgi:hypothetical protein